MLKDLTAQVSRLKSEYAALTDESREVISLIHSESNVLLFHFIVIAVLIVLFCSQAVDPGEK